MSPENRCRRQSWLSRSLWTVVGSCLLLAPPLWPAAQVKSETRTVALPDGSSVEYELGTLQVPENRQNPNSRTISVGYARFRALAPTGAPPTVHLPGGPGNTYVGAMHLDAKDPAERKLNERQAADLQRY